MNYPRIARFRNRLGRTFWWVPKKAAWVLYYPCFILFVLTIKIATTRRVSIWSRNSFYFKNVKLFKSDIDISILVKRRDNLNKLIKALSIVQRTFILIQEVHIFVDDQLDHLSAVINPIELSRDPILRSKMKPEELRPKNSIAKLVFLNRMLESNYSSLKESNYNDYDKWQGYFSFAEITSTSMGANELDFGIINTIKETFLSEYPNLFESITTFLSTLNQHPNYGEVFRLKMPDPIILALFYHRLCFLPVPVEAYDLKLQQIILEQISWEVSSAINWGLNINNRAFLPHLLRLRKGLIQIFSPDLESRKNTVLATLDWVVLQMERLPC